MVPSQLAEKAERYLERLCVEIPSRRVGSEGNRAATDFFAATAAPFGFRTECPEFACIDWEQGGAHLTASGESFDTAPSPYALGCDVSAPLAIVTSADELEAVEIAGDRAGARRPRQRAVDAEELPFLQPGRTQAHYPTSWRQKPGAIVAATSRNPELAGAVYPFPLIEDGDFDIPSVYMTEQEGNRLPSPLVRRSPSNRAWRTPATGCNVMARQAVGAAPDCVVRAHRQQASTPGAIDNATGVVVLLLLAEILTGYEGSWV